ncbi:MAG: glycosyltransferase, partial [Bacteroidota bacterium]|nr:glycosyltransferase [Bacteroidota bacterium]
WNKETEIEDLSKIDIGIMPLPDDMWAKGKCGFKGLQYMALEIPSIMSPVGVNNEIIEDGVNGFLAKTEEEWFEKLSLLIESPAIRKRLGKAGRQTVEQRYSVKSQKERYLEVFEKVLESK